jgi:uncharacterized protein
VPGSDRAWPWRRPGAFGHALARLRGIAKPPITVTEPPGSIVIDREVEVRIRDGTVVGVVLQIAARAHGGNYFTELACVRNC